MLTSIERFLFLAKKQGGLSWWLVALLLLPIARTSIFMRMRSEGSYATVDAFALAEIVLVGLCFLSIVSHINEIDILPLRKSGFIWIVYYYIFSAFSAFWRLDGTSFEYVVYRAGSMAIMTLFAYYFMSHFENAKQAFKGLLNYIIVILGLMIFNHIKSGFFHTNSYSVVAGILLSLSLSSVLIGMYSFSEMQYYIIFGALCLALGTSSGSNVAFFCSLVFILSCRKKGFSIGKFLIFILLTYLVYIFAFDSLFEILFPNKTIGTVKGMTGRWKIWEIYYNAWKTQPWLGLGFAVGERSGSMFGFVYTLSTHNGFLSILVNTGIVGCFFWIVFFSKLFVSIQKHLNTSNKFTIPFTSALVMIIVNNCTAPVLGSIYAAFSMVSMLVISFYVLWGYDKAKSIDEHQAFISYAAN